MNTLRALTLILFVGDALAVSVGIYTTVFGDGSLFGACAGWSFGRFLAFARLRPPAVAVAICLWTVGVYLFERYI